MPLEGFWPATNDDDTTRSLRSQLAELYTKQRALESNPYITEHSSPSAIDAQVTTFLWYRQYLNGAARILDWGCQHGPDSALLRMTNTSAEIYGCDTIAASSYATFRSFTGATYVQLTSQYDLPFKDDEFDAVIASGVLEHVTSDYRSLAELHRVLRPGGRLIITFLPNALSLGELKLRHQHLSGAHERLYTRRFARQLLLHSGFRLVTPVLYQTFAWQRQAERFVGPGDLADRLAALLRVIAPVHVVRASTLCCVAEAVDGSFA